MGGAVEVDGVDDAADDGAVSSSTGQSALSDPVAGGVVPAGSGEGGGVETFGGEGAGNQRSGSRSYVLQGYVQQDRGRARNKKGVPIRPVVHTIGVDPCPWLRLGFDFTELTLNVAVDPSPSI